MLLGVGVDLLHLARLRSVLARRGPERLAARILSCSERVEWEKLAEAGTVQKERFLALRSVLRRLRVPIFSPELTRLGLLQMDCKGSSIQGALPFDRPALGGPLRLQKRSEAHPRLLGPGDLCALAIHQPGTRSHASQRLS